MDLGEDQWDSLEERRSGLRRTCKSFFGHLNRNPVEELERVAAWCRENEIETDVYGTGDFLQGFEEQVAELLGFEAARFMPSGTLAQPIALRLWSDRESCQRIGLHPTSHLELHEEHGYAHLHRLEAELIGEASRPMLAGDLQSCSERLAAVVVELPTRENGGQLPTWDQLQELKQLARKQGTHLHLDGARLWEAQAAFARPFTELCKGFDSAYVSFYKGIGALPGAMLLGPRDFIDEAIIWQRRQGGNFYSNLTNSASAAMRLEPQIARMDSYRKRAVELGLCLSKVDGVRVLPDPPQVNMFHLLFDAAPEALYLARDQVAEETGLWLTSHVGVGDQPNTGRTEFAIYDAAFDIDDDDLVAAFEQMLRLAVHDH